MLVEKNDWVSCDDAPLSKMYLTRMLVMHFDFYSTDREHSNKKVLYWLISCNYAITINPQNVSRRKILQEVICTCGLVNILFIINWSLV